MVTAPQIQFDLLGVFLWFALDMLPKDLPHPEVRKTPGLGAPAADGLQRR